MLKSRSIIFICKTITRSIQLIIYYSKQIKLFTDMAAARSAFRSSSFRSAAAKIAPKIKSTPSPFRFPKPIATPRILRSPVESVCCVESLMPMHSVTAAALLTSMLSVTRGGYGWLAEGQDDTI